MKSALKFENQSSLPVLTHRWHRNFVSESQQVLLLSVKRQLCPFSDTRSSLYEKGSCYQKTDRLVSLVIWELSYNYVEGEIKVNGQTCPFCDMRALILVVCRVPRNQINFRVVIILFVVSSDFIGFADLREMNLSV